MATRIEKKYKTESLKLINTILNYVTDYIKSKKKVGESERQLAKKIVSEVDYFIMKHEITDEEIRKAVSR